MYELSYLISEKISEKDLEQFNAEIATVISNLGGNIINEIKPFKRKLTYPIKKHHYSFFKTFYFDAPEDKIKELIQKLNLNENIIRHILLKSSETLMNEYIARQTRFAAEAAAENYKEAKVATSEESSNDSQETKEEPAEKQEEISEQPDVEAEEKEEEETEAAKEDTTEQAVKEDEKIEEKSSKTKEKIKLEDIDKKIDEILNKTEL